MPNRIPVAQRGPLILAIGKTISINGTLLTVIGVMPEAFHGITQELEPPDIWVPVTMIQEILLEPDMLTPRMLDFKHMVARRSSYSQYAADQAWLDRQIRDYVRAGEGASITPARQKEIERISVRLVSAAHGFAASFSVRGFAQNPYGDRRGGALDRMRRSGPHPWYSHR